MKRRLAGCALVLVVAGCSAPTSVLVSLTLGAGVAAPSALAIDVYGASRALLRAEPLPAAALPAQLLVRLPDVDEPVRIVVHGDGGSPIGHARFDARAHRQVTVEVVLSSTASDEDRDGVPDAVDVCPAVADPPQLDADRDGRGDACTLAGDGGVAGVGAVGFATVGVTRGASALSAAAPAAVAAGDLLVLAVYSVGLASAAQTPAGWTPYGATTHPDGFRAWWFVKVAEAQEPAVQVGFSQATTASMLLGAYRGAFASAPLDPANGAAVNLTGATSSGEIRFTVPSLQLTRAGGQAIAIVVYDSGEGEGWRESAGWTRRADTGVLALFDAARGAAGPTGDLTFAATYASGQGTAGAALVAAIVP